MRIHALSLPAWLAEERSLLRYLASPHDGHPYAEDLLDAVCLLTGWILVVMSVISVVAVIVDGLL